VTVAVNVTDWPKFEGFTDDTTVVVVAVPWTVRFAEAEVPAPPFVEVTLPVTSV